MTPAPPAADAMTPEQFALVRELFHRAFDLSREERTAMLSRECTGRTEVRLAVEELLNSTNTGSGRFDPDTGAIARQLLQEVEEPGMVPEQIGPYRIRQLLGRGGMGEVYLAEQSQPQREVALKIVHGGAGALRGRFAREVRALGRLEHPHIARIYDAGACDTPGGAVWYLAMEYIRGERLTSFAQSAGLSTAERIDLMAKIADAVQHAHTKGVIHRDIKPSNILVTLNDRSGTGSGDSRTASETGLTGPQPKILDFGVARVLDPSALQTDVTEQGAIIGTVAYMSPEQLSGENDAVDARADVYAMGVVLYELLTGRLPYDVRHKPIAEVARVLRDEEPAPLNNPGNAVPGRYDRDLSTIVLHAMQKDRDRRYATAAALADDLRRYVRLEPIMARPSTLAYQVSKFARRHRGLVAGLFAATVALIAGLAISTGLYLRSESQRARADSKERLGSALSDYIINDVLKAAAPDRMGEDATLLNVLLSARDSLHERFAGQPEVEAQVRSALAGVLDGVGKLAESLAEWDAAIPLLERTTGKDSEQTITALLSRTTVLTELRRFRPASDCADDALARAQRALPKDHPLMIRAMMHVAAACAARSEYAKAASICRQAISLSERARGADASEALNLLSPLLYYERQRRQSDPEVTSTIAKQIKERAEELAADAPEKVHALEGLMTYYLKDQRFREAAATADSLMAVVERPGFVPIKHGLLFGRMSRAFLLDSQYEKAEKYGLLSHEAYSKLHSTTNSAHENAAKHMVAVYSAWEGHHDQLRDWCTREVACRMMMSEAATIESVVGAARKAAEMLSTHDSPITAAQVLEDVWERREELAPVGNGRRAAFFANYVLGADAIGGLKHIDESLALASDALPAATQAGVTADLVNAARARRK